MELSRRKWPRLEVGPLETWRKRDIVEAFLKRSLVGRNTGQRYSAENDRGVEMQQQRPMTFLTGVDVVDDGGIGVGDASFSATGDMQADGRPGVCGRQGLVLFQSMIESILSR